MSKYTKVFISIIITLIIIGSVTGIWLYKESKEITPNDEFFVVSIGPSPDINVDYWNLSITGLVEHSMNFTYDNLTSLPDVSAVVTLKCVSGPFGTAEWTGVRLKYILDIAEVSPGAKEVVFHAEDGYTSSLTIDDAMKDDIILAYEMNGEQLPKDHGYPLRLVVPEKYGYKWVKWINEIEVVDYDHKGYWESRGWDDDADITPLSHWWPHALLLSVAAVFGGLATVSGLKLSKYTQFWRQLPFSRKKIRIVTVTYTFLLYAVFIYWVILYYQFKGNLFQTNHGLLALTVIILQSIGCVTGYGIYKGKDKLRLIHLFTTVLAYLLLLGAILTGFILIIGSGV